MKNDGMTNGDDRNPESNDSRKAKEKLLPPPAESARMVLPFIAYRPKLQFQLTAAFEGAAMEENLIGYLLNALDEETHGQVGRYLESASDARSRLELLRGSLGPLALDADQPEPPGDLVDKTLARVEEEAAEAPEPAPVEYATATLSRPLAFLRRLDLAVAACLLICLTGIGIAWTYQSWLTHDRLACQETFRELYVGLDAYRTKMKRFPSVHNLTPDPARNVAGMVVPFLIAHHYLPKNFKSKCPSSKSKMPIKYVDAMKMPADKFHKVADLLNPGLGYSLGTCGKDGTFYGPGYKPGKVGSSWIVLMADIPPKYSDAGNTPNHGSKGQNVLYCDGHCEFKFSRKAGYNGDDIYSNYLKELKAGMGPEDSVVGFGWSKVWDE